MTEPTTWWGTFNIPMEGTSFWRLGPLELWVMRRPYEWQVATRQSLDPMAMQVQVEPPSTPPDPGDGVQIARYAFGTTVDPLHLAPALSDRPIIATPRMPFHVLPGQQATAFLTTPLWVRLRVGAEPLDVTVVPSFFQADTWFGTSTMAGELCYASRTRLHVNLDSLLPHPMRAITPVVLRNHATQPLLVERLRLPVPNLGLYRDGEALWTERVTLDRDHGELARVRIDPGPPVQALTATLLSPARRPQPTMNPVIHAFNAILGN